MVCLKFQLQLPNLGFLVPSHDSWILVPSTKNENFVSIPCAFSRVVVLNLISVLVVSFPLLIIDSSPLEAIVFWNQ